MTVETTGLCQHHTFESSQDVCRRCGGEYCEMCLVFPFGNARPLCKECAMVAGGVRNHATRPEMAKRDVKRKVKAFNARTGNTVTATAAAPEVEISDPVLQDPLTPTADDLERVPEPVPAAPAADDGAEVAAELADVFNTPPPAPPAQEPADGVAPPIDWSQPFG
ncbi:MAG: hypothetical protein AAF548_18240 [Actinomycetota bacterium]